MMKLLDVVNIFLRAVRRVMNSSSPTGARFYVETREGRYLNFKPRVFRAVVKSLVEEEDKYLDYFRRLKLIVVEGPDRFTNIQWINGKSARVITIDKEVLETLIELTKNE